MKKRNWMDCKIFRKYCTLEHKCIEQYEKDEGCLPECPFLNGAYELPPEEFVRRITEHYNGGKPLSRKETLQASKEILEDAEKARREEFNPVQVMVKINGKSFRCECGSNVQTKYAENRYKCNGCGAKYVGE